MNFGGRSVLSRDQVQDMVARVVTKLRTGEQVLRAEEIKELGVLSRDRHILIQMPLFIIKRHPYLICCRHFSPLFHSMLFCNAGWDALNLFCHF